jgi:NAD(P) transhydrogenase subunit beta
MMGPLAHIAYLFAAILFILGLKDLSSPKTARRGNQRAILGMSIAVILTLLNRQILDYRQIILGLLIGSAIGAVAARRVQMTAMPQMVALFNGFGGAASSLVASSQYEYYRASFYAPTYVIVTIILSVLIGTVTFAGSLVAFAKLQGIVRGLPVFHRMQNITNAFLIVILVILSAMIVSNPSIWITVVLLLIGSAVLGVSLVIRIGGADMPVVISLLNSFSGLAASATGFVISSNILIISGALVGASGLILTNIMCKAMNRSLVNVLFAGVGTESESLRESLERRQVTQYTLEDAAAILESAQSVIIVPGYGLAVAQAQHVLREVATILMERGAQVRYAIHPVAGRMPGHMNVLLAEANVSYEFLYDLDEINDEFQHTDVVLAVGANDVINPAARYKKQSPLYGMPILNVDKARSIIICKRSLSPGFSGEDNELFYDAKTMMIFGDAKNTLTKLVQILKQ